MVLPVVFTGRGDRHALLYAPARCYHGRFTTCAPPHGDGRLQRNPWDTWAGASVLRGRNGHCKAIPPVLRAVKQVRHPFSAGDGAASATTRKISWPGSGLVLRRFRGLPGNSTFAGGARIQLLPGKLPSGVTCPGFLSQLPHWVFPLAYRPLCRLAWGSGRLPDPAATLLIRNHWAATHHCALQLPGFGAGRASQKRTTGRNPAWVGLWEAIRIYPGSCVDGEGFYYCSALVLTVFSAWV